MKKLFWFTLLLPFASSSQNNASRKIFLDSLFYETNEINHVYYRIVEDFQKKQRTYKMVDFYKSGAKYGEVYSQSNHFKDPIGEEILFYENGNKKQSVRYAEDGKSGPYETWYPDGSTQTQGFYDLVKEKNSATSTLKINQFWNAEKSQTVINGNGHYKLHHDDGNDEGIIKDGLKDGIWQGADYKKRYTYTEKYSNGKLSAGVSIDQDSIKHIYRELETKPEFVGGMNAFYMYVAKNFQVPDIDGLQGTLFISFYVEKDGSLDEIKIIRSLGKQVDEEGYRILTMSPSWKPAEIRGIKKRVLYSLPIKIQGNR